MEKGYGKNGFRRYNRHRGRIQAILGKDPNTENLNCIQCGNSIKLCGCSAQQPGDHSLSVEGKIYMFQQSDDFEKGISSKTYFFHA